MAFLEIRTSTSISAVLIALGLPASAAFLCFGLACLAHPTNPDGGIGAGLVFCGMGVFILLMAIAAFRGILRRKKLQHFHCSPEWGKSSYSQRSVVRLHLVAIPPLQDHGIGDDLAHLAEMAWHGRQTLDLRETQISDRGLVHLSRLRGLQELDLRQTEVTEVGLDLENHVRGNGDFARTQRWRRIQPLRRQSRHLQYEVEARAHIT